MLEARIETAGAAARIVRLIVAQQAGELVEGHLFPPRADDRTAATESHLGGA